jgi:2-C-methyl-D-erythritol 4-phosphate cytidylyltransferase
MVSAVIVAAGRGTRMGTAGDKLFLDLAGWPVVAHTWRRFEAAPDIGEIVFVTRTELQPAFGELAGRLGVRKPYRLVPGGAERQDSVANGLAALDPRAELVAIHDAARPCVPVALIGATIAAARETGAAVAAQRVTDTIKESDDGVVIARHLDRNRLWAVQTPQTFRVEIIRRAIAAARARGLNLTDDTAACECIGQPVRLVESARPNPKITVPQDLAMAALLVAEP